MPPYYDPAAGHSKQPGDSTPPTATAMDAVKMMVMVLCWLLMCALHTSAVCLDCPDGWDNEAPDPASGCPTRNTYPEGSNYELYCSIWCVWGRVEGPFH